jgi:hypothetical protein
MSIQKSSRPDLVVAHFHSQAAARRLLQHYRHEAANPGCPLSGRYRVISGQQILKASFSAYDPCENAAPDVIPAI